MNRTMQIMLVAGVVGAALGSMALSAVSTVARAESTPLSSASVQNRLDDKVGTVDVLRCLERMLESPDYVKEREDGAAVWNEQIQKLLDEQDAIKAKAGDLKPDDPSAKDLYQQFQSLNQRIGALQQQAVAAIDKLSAEQISKAYKIIHQTVKEVGTSKGYSRVLASRMTTDDIVADNTNSMVQEVLLRPVIYANDADDLTDAVIEALNIPEPPPAPEPAQDASDQDADQGAAGAPAPKQPSPADNDDDADGDGDG